MFKKLRNKFILTNLVTTTLVLVTAFTIIYIIVAANVHKRPPLQRGGKIEYTDDALDYLNDRLTEEREASLRTLMASLVITGVGVEIIVFFVSLYLAEQSIAPVKTAYKAQKEFIANASHEIKTPLAAIQANLEAADIKNNHWIDNVAIKTEELAALNAKLLTLARAEAGAIDETLEKINLHDFVLSTISPLKPQIAKKQLRLKITANQLKKSEITIAKSALYQVFNILLDNAIKYSKNSIIITITDHQISIKNDGATIDPAHLDHIFDRFYQTDKTKNGVGLGLAIAKQISNAHHWQLTAASDQKSTTFTLTF